ncbi:MAG TPA: anti-sigma factor [Candidatus Acidoferrum sp.]|nr:anti-sigma factor [Candidatus Acidoferrum sp.]
MTHEPYETQAAVYVLGALDGEERSQFEEHLAGGCVECAEAVREHAETLADVARDAPPMIPPAHVKTDLMRRVSATGSARATRRRSWLRWAAVSAAAVVGVSAFAAGFVASRYEARIGAMARETARVRAELHRQEAELRDRLAVAQGVNDLLSDPAARVVALRGSGPGDEAWGRLVWDDAKGGYLVVANVPAAPAGKVYELWTISGGQPRPAGLFTVDASGRATHPVAPTRSPVDVFAVTLEPAGGVPAPTGPIVLASAK